MTNSGLKDGKGKLVIFIPQGFPNWKESEELVDTLVEAGADALELGIPFHEDFLEGSSISAANAVSLANGYTLTKGLEFLANLRKSHTIPITVSTWYDPILMMGPEKFAEKFKSIGLSVLLADAIPEMVTDWLEIAEKAQVGTAFLATPRQSLERIIEISKSCTDYMYVTAAKGLCGATTDENNAQYDFFSAIKEAVDVPILGGFGVNSVDRAREVGKHTNAVAIGSAVLEPIMNASSFSEGKKKVAEFVSQVSEGLKKGW